MKITYEKTGDEFDDTEIARQIKGWVLATPQTVLMKSVIAIMPKQKQLTVIGKEKATQYFVRKNEAIIVDMPELVQGDPTWNITQIALAVGRRLERFERGAKANATRTPNSRKKIAQNAIQSRWNAK